MTNKDGTWICPECKIVGSINGRNIEVRNKSWVWPMHPDCEWTKTIDELDVSKLERVD